MKVIRPALALLAQIVVLVVPAPAAHAAAIDVKGRVIHIADGDTIDVDVYGDGTSTPVRTRIAGVQAMEIHVPQTTSDDECHAKQAQDYLKYLLRPKDLYGTGHIVRLRADSSSSSSLGRPLRFVTRNSDGLDVGKALIDAQYALAFPLSREPSHNKVYMTAAQVARDSVRGMRIYDTDGCRAGPNQSVPLRVWANYHREGTYEGERGEWVKIQNVGTSSITMSGWTMRDASHTTYRMPTRTISAGRILTIYIVNDDDHTNTTSSLYFNPPSATSYLEDSNSAKTMGDAVYLVDQHGDFRANFMFPCLATCADPLQGKVDITVNWDAPGAEYPNGEWIDIHNTSGGSITLSRNYLLEYGTSSAAATFMQFSNTAIPAGETLRIYAGTGQNSTLVKYWGKTSPLLANSGGWVRVRTWDDRLIDRTSWS